jgi:hypothetical protein
MTGTAPDPTELAQACDRVWGAYGRLERIDPADAALLAATPGNLIAAHFKKRPPVERVQLEVPEGSPPVPPEFAAFVAGFLTLGTQAWADYLEHCAASDEAFRERRLQVERYSGWLDRAVRDGGVTFMDPTSGREVAACDGVQIFDRTVYSFFGDVLFFLIAAGGGSKAVGLYVPADNRFYDFGATIGSAGSDEGLANVFGHLLRRLAARQDEYHGALAARADGPRRVVLMVGKMQNFAHHVWNFYSGIERLVIGGLIGRVAEVRFAGTEFFGPVTTLYPELAEADFHRESRTPVRDPHPFSPTHVLVPTGGYFMPRTLIDRISRTMAAMPPTGSPEPATTSFGRPLVWIGLRLGDKSWAAQETDVPRLVDNLLARYPEATVLLDGYSFPLAHDEVSEKWEETIAELARLADQIVRRIGRPGRVLDLVGNSLRESVLWAGQVDAYIAPTGTTQHKVGWFTDAPGIIYASPGIERVPLPRRPGAWESEISTPPRYAFGSAVEHGRRRTPHDRRRNIENLEVDVDVLTRELFDLLHDRFESRAPRAVERARSLLGRVRGSIAIARPRLRRRRVR